MSRVILVAPSDPAPDVLASRLRMQGYEVDVAKDAGEAAVKALGAPPAAVVADLWMPNISGVQLCRLLKAESATADVPVVLRGPDGQRNRFWAEHAGAVAYVVQGRIGDLVRALRRSVKPVESDGFFLQIDPATIDVRDRIAAHLDAALFDSVIASEVRALGSCGNFERLFDLFSQFVAQVTSYRWLAVSTAWPPRLAIHNHPSSHEIAAREARDALGLSAQARVIAVEDEDARDGEVGPPAIVAAIDFGGEMIGRVALATCAPAEANDIALVKVIARELAGPMRIVSLLEESQRQATTDALTGLMNRRACLAATEREVARAERSDLPISLLLLDVDHFKTINDRRGHATGDTVLSAIGKLLQDEMRNVDIAARWGGEEFVVVLWNADQEGALVAAERIRAALSCANVKDAKGETVPVTASFGVAERGPGETIESWIDRADRAMYSAKSSGRDRCVCAPVVRRLEAVGA